MYKRFWFRLCFARAHLRRIYVTPYVLWKSPNIRNRLCFCGDSHILCETVYTYTFFACWVIFILFCIMLLQMISTWCALFICTLFFLITRLVTSITYLTNNFKLFNYKRMFKYKYMTIMRYDKCTHYSEACYQVYEVYYFHWQ